MYRILSLDGGGIYGTLQAVLLERIFAAMPNFLDHTDLIAGTSIGGVIALTLAKPLPPSQIRELFQSNAKKVFTGTVTRKAGSWVGLKAKYDNTALEKVLKSYFGDMVLGNLKKHVLVPSFELSQHGRQPQQWRAKFFHNIPGNDSDNEERVVKVGMATSAAPIYFPSYQNYLDGAFVENNPSACAVAQTQDERNKIPRPGLSEIRLFSLGRNSTNHHLDGFNHDWGWAKWIQPVVDMS